MSFFSGDVMISAAHYVLARGVASMSARSVTARRGVMSFSTVITFKRKAC
jgi:hypothetical protein